MKFSVSEVPTYAFCAPHTSHIAESDHVVLMLLCFPARCGCGARLGGRLAKRQLGLFLGRWFGCDGRLLLNVGTLPLNGDFGTLLDISLALREGPTGDAEVADLGLKEGDESMSAWEVLL